jgi:hypothetical protein
MNGYIRSNRGNVRRVRLSTSFQMHIIRRLTLALKGFPVAGEGITAKNEHGKEASRNYLHVCDFCDGSFTISDFEGKSNANSVAFVRQRTIPTVRLHLIQVSANYCR